MTHQSESLSNSSMKSVTRLFETQSRTLLTRCEPSNNSRQNRSLSLTLSYRNVCSVCSLALKCADCLHLKFLHKFSIPLFCCCRLLCVYGKTKAHSVCYFLHPAPHWIHHRNKMTCTVDSTGRGALFWKANFSFWNKNIQYSNGTSIWIPTMNVIITLHYAHNSGT